MNDIISLKKQARIILHKRAMTTSFITYIEFANVLKISAPPVITAVTKLLEVFIEEDVNSGQPIISSIVVQKGLEKLPRRGFFEKLHALGVINLNDTNFCKKTWHQNELNKLKKL